MRAAETERREPAGAGREADWSSALDAWPRTRAHAQLRAYGDAVNAALVEEWLTEPARLLLKTDLFDEAVGRGLYSTLAEHAESVHGIDVSPAVVGEARRRHPGLDADVADVRRLPHDNASFDAVLSNSTLDHFAARKELAAAVRELHRVLEPGGRLLITLDNPLHPLVALRNALPRGLLARTRLVPHYVGATLGPRALRGLLTEAGFEVERVEAAMHVPRVLVLALAAAAPGRSAGLTRLERLGRLPTRYVTGQFVVARARRT